MSKRIFYIALCLIVFLGIGLRIKDYDRTPPFGTTKDEFMYPLAGMSLLKTGVQTSWSDFSAYPKGQYVKYWGESFRLVKPWNEKPPLYSLITGGISLFMGASEFNQVRLSTIRLIPIALSFVTIVSLGLLGRHLFSPTIGLIASLLYSITPTMVLANRLSLTENLLAPLVLLALLLSLPLLHKERVGVRSNILLGILCALIVLTKQIGIALPLVLLIFFVSKRDWQSIFIVGGFTALGASISPLMGYLTDWNLYQNMMTEFSRAHTLGLPETIYTLFRFPGIGHKEAIFLDGSMLLGFVALLSSPFWLLNKTHNSSSSTLDPKPYTLAFPLSYLFILTLLEGGTTWYGWHLFPLYPFMSLSLAYLFYHLWKSQDIWQLITYLMILGASTLRFFLLFNPELVPNWPMIAIFFSIIIFGSWVFLKSKYKSYLLIVLFALFVLTNIWTIYHLDQIYPTKVQPLSIFQTSDSSMLIERYKR